MRSVVQPVAQRGYTCNGFCRFAMLAGQQRFVSGYNFWTCHKVGDRSLMGTQARTIVYSHQCCSSVRLADAEPHPKGHPSVASPNGDSKSSFEFLGTPSSMQSLAGIPIQGMEVRMCLGTGVRGLEWNGVVEGDGTVHLKGNGHQCTGKVTITPTRNCNTLKGRLSAATERDDFSGGYFDGAFDVVFAARNREELERDLKIAGKRATSKALLRAREEDTERRGRHYCKMAFRSANTVNAEQVLR